MTAYLARLTAKLIFGVQRNNEKQFFHFRQPIIIRLSMIDPHRINRTFPLIKVVEARLTQKYQHPFAFYRVKPINEMLFGHYHRKTHIDLCDVRTYADETEFMRRTYYYNTVSGR
jgi:predicted glycoside hydrolase/deacetylase ChbG (UPF0249 family)